MRSDHHQKIRMEKVRACSSALVVRGVLLGSSELSRFAKGTLHRVQFPEWMSILLPLVTSSALHVNGMPLSSVHGWNWKFSLCRDIRYPVISCRAPRRNDMAR